MPDNKKFRVAILTENGFEQSELISPKEALEKEGVEVDIISPQKEKVRGWNKGEWGIELPVDKHISEVSPDDYDGLVLPGGVINPDKLRMDKDSVEFVKSFFYSGKMLAAICHGPQILINADVVEGRQLTSYPSIKLDLINAGARWVDQEVVVESGLVTSRSPKDLPAFNKKVIEELKEGTHQRSDPALYAKH